MPSRQSMEILGAVTVRNIGPDGSGVEFVHVKEEDHERLRRLVQKHL